MRSHRIGIPQARTRSWVGALLGGLDGGLRQMRTKNALRRTRRMDLTTTSLIEVRWIDRRNVGSDVSSRPAAGRLCNSASCAVSR